MKMGDVTLTSNPEEFQKVAKTASELERVLNYYQEFKETEKTLKESENLLKDSNGHSILILM